MVPPAERRDLTHTVTAAERGKPVVSPHKGKRLSQEALTGRRVKEEGASEGRSVMGRIGVAPQGNITSRRKPADFPLVLAYVNREQTDLRKQSRNVGGAQRSCWCGFRRFRCWLSRSNVQVVRTATADNRVPLSVRWSMLEPYASKGARTVLRGGGSGDRASLPDRQERPHALHAL